MTAAASQGDILQRINKALAIIASENVDRAVELEASLTKAGKDKNAVRVAVNAIFDEANRIIAERERQAPAEPRVQATPVQPKKTTIRSTPTARSTVVHIRKIEKTRPWFERLLGVIILLVSFIGSIFAVNGGWDQTWVSSDAIAGAMQYVAPVPFTSSALLLNVPMTLIAIGLQSFLTYTQIIYRGRNWRYILSLLVDMILTTLGFYDVAIPPLSKIAVAAWIPTAWAWWIALIALVGITFGSSWIPEKILIDRD